MRLSESLTVNRNGGTMNRFYFKNELGHIFFYNLKAIILLLLLLIPIGKIKAQGYIPEIGDTIIFYPLSEKSKLEYSGYDCFYHFNKIITPKNKSRYFYINKEEKIYVQTKTIYKFNDEYRYKINENNLTPFKEIENKLFKVIKTENYIPKGKIEEKTFLLFLVQLESNTEIVMRIPYIGINKSSITNNFIVEKKYQNGNKTKDLHVNIPCISYNYIENFKKTYIGKELLYKEKHNLIDANKELDLEAFLSRKDIFNDISKKVNAKIIRYDFNLQNITKCLNVEFEESELTEYTHPFVICTYCQNLKVDTLKIPLTYMAGKTLYYNSYIGSNYLFENFYALKETELENIFKREKCIDLVEAYSGKNVFYGLVNSYSYEGELEPDSKYNAENIVEINNNSTYVLEVNSIYKCLRFDVYKKDKQNNYEVCAILQDSSGVIFRVPAKATFNGTNIQRGKLYANKHFTKNFQDYFMFVDKALEIKKERDYIALQQEKENQEKYASLVKKYGSVYAEFVDGLSTLKQEKFERLSRKYGKATAKMMLEGKVRIGWSKEMCIESWGEPEDINKTIGRWGTHEQWVYGYNYLYFENGVLTTIQN